MAGFLGFVFIVFVILAFVVSPSVIASNLEFDKKTRRIILWFDIAPIIMGVFNGIFSAIIKLEFVVLFFLLIQFASFTLPLVSYIIILINMKKLGYFKDKSKNISPITNFVFYVLEFLILLLPILNVPSGLSGEIKSYNGFNMQESMSIFFYIIVGAIIVGVILNLIFRDIRKTIIINTISQLLYLGSAISVTEAVIEYPGQGVSGGFGLILMVFVGIVGTLLSISQGFMIEKITSLEVEQNSSTNTYQQDK